ncbi:MAG: sterol desaturase family protein [bacterium]|nr:sterol desaturase family protein [bacterium]
MEFIAELPVAARLGLPMILFTLVAWEAIWSRRSGRHVYEWRESLANAGVFVGMQVSKAIFFGWQLLVLSFAGSFGLAEWSGGVAAFLATFLITDFLYYWQHRIMHESKVFWAFHLVHHSAQKLNLSTSFRLNWLSPLIVGFFFIPAVLLGAPPVYVIASLGINLLYQFFLHTTAIGKLGRLEGMINTPSAHRVHHASNPEYLDRNYGGVLMIWDRIFGTYAAEGAPARYGVTTGPVGYNPFVLVFHGFVDLFRGRLESRG